MSPVSRARTWLVVLVTLVAPACDSATQQLCGELTGARKSYAAALNMAYAQRLHVEQIPCYPNYLRVACLTQVADTALDSIESSARRFGWDEVLVYDQKGELLRGNVGSM